MTRFALAGCIILLAMPAVFAQSDEARRACQGDAQKICAADIPDRAKVRVCLVANKAKLSEACKKVIENAGG
jgi:hypothetical protein